MAARTACRRCRACRLRRFGWTPPIPPPATSRPVSKKIPGYLRLHTEEEACAAVNRRPWDGLLEAFEKATGWRLQPQRSEPCAEENDPHRLQLSGPADSASAGGEMAVAHLVDRLNQLLVELQQTRATLSEREAELAAAPLGELELRGGRIAFGASLGRDPQRRHRSHRLRQRRNLYAR